jgi:hypothetical protein
LKHWDDQNLWKESARGFIMDEYNFGGLIVRRRRGTIKMLVALEINAALWGMIICATMEAAQLFEPVF